MTTNDKPWSSNWISNDELGHGGQGTTYLVKNLDGSRQAVMKVLRNQRSTQARRRMFQEVANLKVLESAGCKVPIVLDSNVQQFETNDVPLYFVMQHIPGPDLSTIVCEKGSLAFNIAAPLMLDMVITMRKALQEGVLHRDLKPENIIVRSLDPPDIVIVDYGLSFNDELDEGVTRVSETLDNKFLSLPERRVPGGDRRDPRSDITGLCGLLYFCLTGSMPVDLVGSDGRPPHRREGHSIREKLDNDPVVSRLEAFFDRAFNPHIDNRYQSLDEMTTRLQEVINPAFRTTTENPIDVARQAAETLLKQDRKTQIAAFLKSANALPAQLEKIRAKYSRDLLPFTIEPHGELDRNMVIVPDTEAVGVKYNVHINHAHNPQRVIIAYQVRAKGAECAVFRTMVQWLSQNSPKCEVLEPWQALFWYQGLCVPDIEIVIKDFEASIISGLRLLQQIILEKRTNK